MSKTNGNGKAGGNGKARKLADLESSSSPPRNELGQLLPGARLNPSGARLGYAAKIRAQLHKLLDEAAIDGQGVTRVDVLLRAIYERAVEGDMQAAKLILDRVFPATLQAQIDITNMTPGRVIDVFAVLERDFITRGELPSVPQTG